MLEHAAHHLAEVVVVLDGTGTVRWVNDVVTRVLGWPPEAWLGHRAEELVHIDDVAMGLEVLATTTATGEGVTDPVAFRFAHADGGFIEMAVISSNVRLADGGLALVVSARQAGTSRPQTALLDEVAQRVWAMFERSLLGMAQVALDGRIMRANRRIAHLVGADDGSALIGVQLADLIYDDEGEVLHGPGGLLVGAGGERAQVRLCHVHADPEHPETYTRLAAALVHDLQGRPLYYALQAVDISDLVHTQQELRTAEVELLHHLRHDPMTGLPNRSELADWLHRPARHDDAVLFVDLDDFKAVNDTYGHAAGDAVLVAVASCLRSHLRHSDLVARIGGDEFVVLCPRTDEATAIALAHRLVTAIAYPVPSAKGDLVVGASIGVATGDDAATYESVIARADLALYEAKDAPGSSVVAFCLP